MAQVTKVFGKTIKSMVKVLKLCQMEANLKVFTKSVKNLDLVSRHSRMGPCIMAIGKITRSKVLESRIGIIVNIIRANGKRIACMDMDTVFTRTESFMMVNLKVIKDMDTEFMAGQIATLMLVGGTKINSTGLE